MARVMAEHFIGAERLIEIRDMVQRVDDAAEIIAELECAEEKTP
jgi:helicase